MRSTEHGLPSPMSLYRLLCLRLCLPRRARSRSPSRTRRSRSRSNPGTPPAAGSPFGSCCRVGTRKPDPTPKLSSLRPYGQASALGQALNVPGVRLATPTGSNQTQPSKAVILNGPCVAPSSACHPAARGHRLIAKVPQRSEGSPALRISAALRVVGPAFARDYSHLPAVFPGNPDASRARRPGTHRPFGPCGCLTGA